MDLGSNVQVNYEGYNVTDYVIEYARTHDMCSGVGTLEVAFTKEFPYSAEPWDNVVLYEEGHKKGTYNVVALRKTAENGNINLVCQDDSKKLVDYFVAKSYEPTYVTTARYWIEKFLTEAKVSYEFNTNSNGAQIAENTGIGFGTAYDIILTFLQQSGWYIYFNPNGKAIIGTLNVNTSSVVDRFSDDKMLSIMTKFDDKMLRNRAVVWGNSSIVEGTTVGADISVNTPYNYDSTDKRAIVYTNPSIKSSAAAYGLASQLLSEFAKPTYEKTVEMAGAFDIEIGDIIMIRSQIYTGTGMVSIIQSTLSSDGLITTVTVDIRCPRLFGYYLFDGYVYIGTWGNGIWRKPLGTGSWSDYSSGLLNLEIADLYINNGVFVCVANDGYAYTRIIGDTAWSREYHGSFTDADSVTYSSSEVKAVACSIDRMSNNIFVAYNATTGADRSWMTIRNGYGNLISKYQIFISSQFGIQDALVQDFDVNFELNAITVVGPGWIMLFNEAVRAVYPDTNPGMLDIIVAPYINNGEVPDQAHGNEMSLSGYVWDSGTFYQSNICLFGGTLMYLSYNNLHFVSWDIDGNKTDGVIDVTKFGVPSEISGGQVLLTINIEEKITFTHIYNGLAKAYLSSTDWEWMFEADPDHIFDDESFVNVATWEIPGSIKSTIMFQDGSINIISKSTTVGEEYDDINGVPSRSVLYQYHYTYIKVGFGGSQSIVGAFEGIQHIYIGGWGGGCTIIDGGYIPGSGNMTYWFAMVIYNIKSFSHLGTPEIPEDAKLGLYYRGFKAGNGYSNNFEIKDQEQLLVTPYFPTWYGSLGFSSNCYVRALQYDRMSGLSLVKMSAHIYEELIQPKCVLGNCIGGGGWTACAFQKVTHQRIAVLNLAKKEIFSMIAHAEDVRMAEVKGNCWLMGIYGCDCELHLSNSTDYYERFIFNPSLISPLWTNGAGTSSAIYNYASNPPERHFASDGTSWTVMDLPGYSGGGYGFSTLAGTFTNFTFINQSWGSWVFSLSGKYLRSIVGLGSLGWNPNVVYLPGYVISKVSGFVPNHRWIKLDPEAYQFNVTVTLKNTGTTFVPVTYDGYYMKVDTAKQVPPITYPVINPFVNMATTYTLSSGILVTQISGATNVFQDSYYVPSGFGFTKVFYSTMDGFTSVAGSGAEERSFDLDITYNPMTLISGEFNVDFDRYIGATIGKDFRFTSTSGGSFNKVLGTFSEKTRTLETSNYETIPYIFVGTAGSNGQQKFYERGHTSYSQFVDRSSGLPAGNITIIRLDDRM